MCAGRRECSLRCEAERTCGLGLARPSGPPAAGRPSNTAATHAPRCHPAVGQRLRSGPRPGPGLALLLTPAPQLRAAAHNGGGPSPKPTTSSGIRPDRALLEPRTPPRKVVRIRRSQAAAASVFDPSVVPDRRDTITSAAGRGVGWAATRLPPGCLDPPGHRTRRRALFPTRRLRPHSPFRDPRPPIPLVSPALVRVLALTPARPGPAPGDGRCWTMLSHSGQGAAGPGRPNPWQPPTPAAVGMVRHVAKPPAAIGGRCP